MRCWRVTFKGQNEHESWYTNLSIVNILKLYFYYILINIGTNNLFHYYHKYHTLNVLHLLFNIICIFKFPLNA